MPMKLRSRRIPGENPDETEDLLQNPEDADGSDSEDENSDEFVVISSLKQVNKTSDAANKGIKGDEGNIAILLFLYILQGIPLGLGGAVPLILTNHHVSYKEQAEFSFAYWPFSIKLLWAPIVDSCFISKFGRRKTWLVPVQYLIGITMLLLSQNVNYYLGETEGGPSEPNVLALTMMFFFLNFLAATQDIAVDGWALTMLQRHNVGYASTCNSVGQTAGYFLGYVFYIALESFGLITLKGFLFFWGIVFLITTTLVAVFKHENTTSDRNSNLEEDDEPDLGVAETYSLLFKIIRLPLMPALIFMLLTAKIAFSATDSVSTLKLIEKGVPKAKLAMLSVPMMPLQILLPFLISRYTAGPKPMNVYLKAIPPRLLMGLVIAGAVYVTPSFMLDDKSFPIQYYVMIVAIYAVHQVCLYSMFVSIMAFFARISDPAVGGTYMTLLNTVCNLGGNWPATLALWCVDFITVKECLGGDKEKIPSNNFCDGSAQTDICEGNGGTCNVLTEGFYIETIGCLIFGILWLLWGWPTIKRLQNADVTEWRVVKSKKEKA